MHMEILLTKDLLLKFGFERIKIWKAYSKNDFIVYFEEKDESDYHAGNEFDWIIIKYVDTLKELYFKKTGLELI